MPIRRLCALTVAVLLVAPPAAFAQSTDSGSTGTATLFIIAGGLVLAFVVVGLWISRDARRALPPDERDDAPPRHLEPEERRKLRQDRSRLTAKRRAQRAARRRNR
jgi:hypothetical protein